MSVVFPLFPFMVDIKHAGYSMLSEYYSGLQIYELDTIGDMHTQIHTHCTKGGEAPLTLSFIAHSLLVLF